MKYRIITAIGYHILVDESMYIKIFKQYDMGQKMISIVDVNGKEFLINPARIEYIIKESD